MQIASELAALCTCEHISMSQYLAQKLHTTRMKRNLVLITNGQFTSTY